MPPVKGLVFLANFNINTGNNFFLSTKIANFLLYSLLFSALLVLPTPSVFASHLCGNGVCDANDANNTHSENPTNCPQDCNSTEPSCGDGVCDANAENCGTCAADCGCGAGENCCSNACQEIGCANNAACNDNNPCTSDECQNPGACNSNCSWASLPNNTQCDGNNSACCNGDCIDVGSDRDNCGACGNACNAGEACENGECVSQCGDGLCDANIGEGCGVCAADCACGANMECVNNACVNFFCGNNACNPERGEDCKNCARECGSCPLPGTCKAQDHGSTNAPSCGNDPFKRNDCCVQLCTDTASDPLNCGSCGNSCGLLETCKNGRCLPYNCSNQTSPLTGGCPNGLTCCGNALSPGTPEVPFYTGCAALTTSKNCGACGNDCTSLGVGYQCLQCDANDPNCYCSGSGCWGCQKIECLSSSQCTPGTTCCKAVEQTTVGPVMVSEKSSCTPTSYDPRNCGACGNKCAAGSVCLQGQCVSSVNQCASNASCAVIGSGYKCCASPLGNACTQTSNPQNCGSCGNACGQGPNAQKPFCCPSGGVYACSENPCPPQLQGSTQPTQIGTGLDDATALALVAGSITSMQYALTILILGVLCVVAGLQMLQLRAIRERFE
ncbi:MAG TPA: hypothetical protein VJA40_03640 [archaeon]|nr:hypothetical protein [archaeon]